MNIIKNNNKASLPSSSTANTFRGFICSTVILVFCFFSAIALADIGVEQASSDFDHLSTGFFLSPSHQDVECSDCHVRGVFKGTPTTCNGCHNSSTVITALGKNSGHVSSTDNCEECHGDNGLKWTEINFKTHDAVIGDCSSCHDGGIALGKSKNHIPSSDKCEDCHFSTSTYSTGVFDHIDTNTGCSVCHDGIQATGKTSDHIKTTSVCESCHKSTDLFNEVGFVDHDHVLGSCFSCHNGDISIGKSPQHIPSNIICDDCHNTTSFSGAIFDHSGTTANCFSCHDGIHDGASDDRSGRHIPSSETCESCHTAQPKDWYVITNVDHNDVFAGTCDNCHKSRAAIGPIKSERHIPSNNECDDCHNTNTFTGALFDHSGTTTNCYGCHDDNHDGASDDRSGRHPDSTTTCESCHTAQPKDWYVITNVDHSDVLTGTCSECHAGRNPYGTIKPNGHIASSKTCDNCHLQAGTQWAGAVDLENAPNSINVVSQTSNEVNQASSIPEIDNKKLIALKASQDLASISTPSSSFVHPDVSENCLNCHNGTVAEGKKLNHFPTADSCHSCHQINSWSPVTRFDHDAALGSCAACHNKVLATGQPIKHINTTKSCDDCHSDTHWSPVQRVDHTATRGSCFSCHNRRDAQGKPLTHISSDNNCDNCHVTHSWSHVVMDHSNVTGSCSTCHTGRSAPAKPANHIPSNNTCNDCHRRITWTPVYRVDHLAVVGSCSSCHNGKMAEGKSKNHPNTNTNCEECHRSNLWSQVTFNHDNVSGTCLSCHINDYKQQSHKKTKQGNIFYNANELVDCSSSCHIYEDNTFSTIYSRRPGPDHRPARGAW